MSALFSAVVVKAAVFVISFLLAAPGPTSNSTTKAHVPFRVVTIKTVSAAQEKESTDTTKAEKSEKSQKAEGETETAPKPKKIKKQSVKISISDEGIKVGSKDGEERIILELEAQELDRGLEDLEYDLQILQDLPESVSVMLLSLIHI